MVIKGVDGMIGELIEAGAVTDIQNVFGFTPQIYNKYKIQKIL